MERDVELQLTSQMAAMEAMLAGFAKDVTRRLDRIETQTTLTNGRVSSLERVNASAVAVSSAVLKPRPVGLSDLRLYLTIAIGSGTMAVGVVLWVLKVAGVLQ